MLNTETIQSLIDSGEGYNVEFKVRVPSKVRELTEEICAFANADGGYLMFRPARINLIYFPVLSMSVRGQTHRNFTQPKKCAASFRSVTKSFSTIYPAIGSISTWMQTNR